LGAPPSDANAATAVAVCDAPPRGGDGGCGRKDPLSVHPWIDDPLTAEQAAEFEKTEPLGYYVHPLWVAPCPYMKWCRARGRPSVQVMLGGEAADRFLPVERRMHSSYYRNSIRLAVVDVAMVTCPWEL
jgi:hypothetical protein